jgi:hypothetical protein
MLQRRLGSGDPGTDRVPAGKPQTPGNYVPPKSPPLELWLVVALFALIGMAATPKILIALGPLRESLTSDVELTRGTAEMTVLLSRLFFVGAALGVAGIIFYWKSIVSGRFFAALAVYQAAVIEPSQIARISRLSMSLSLGAVFAGISYIAFIAQWLPGTIRERIAYEDGLIEQATAVLFFAASAGALAVAFRLYGLRKHNRPFVRRGAVWHTLLGLFFFVCVGEEISWGQRIFGFETTAAFKEINVQGEMNLHNSFGYLADHLFIAGVAVYGALLPFLAWRYRFWRQVTGWLGLPLASTGLAIGFLLVSGIHDWTVYSILPDSSGVRAPELRELLSAFCFVLLVAESWMLSRNLPVLKSP